MQCYTVHMSDKFAKDCLTVRNDAGTIMSRLCQLDRQLPTQHMTLHAGRGLMQGKCYASDGHMQSPCTASQVQAAWA